MTDCGPFGIVAYIFTAWEQGYLGIIISVLALVVGMGLAIRFQWFKGVPIAIALALVLYFFPEALAAIMGVNPDACQSSYRSAQITASNLRSCEPLITSYEASGEDCSCNGLQPTPVCRSYYAACENSLPGYDSSTEYCSCAFADTQRSSQPECEAIASSSVVPDSLNVTQACYSTTSQGGWPDVAAACSNPQYETLQTADWVGPTPDFDNSANGAAYYTYQTVIDNPTESPINADWYGESDNTGWYFVNGQQVGYSTSWSAGNDLPIVLQPGQNVIDVTVQNTPQSLTGPDYGPNPTGTIDKITGTGGNTVYAQTGGNSWQEVSGPPTTPSPPPSTPLVNCYTTSCAG